jgi:hypothetical protein
MAKIVIDQKWSRKEDGGKVLAAHQLVIDGGTWTLNGAPLPEATKEFVARFGFRQIIANTYAGEASFAAAQAGIAEKIAALKSGEISARGGSGDPLASYRRAIVTDALSDEDRKAFDAAPKDGKAKWLDAFFAKADDAFRNEVDAIAADALADTMKRKARARALKGLKA